MAKPQGKCIFCGGHGLTKEHIYPQWIQGVLPKRFTRTRHIVSDVGVWGDGHMNRQGDPLVQKVYRVCRNCNTGWMSNLQERAKPILTPLLRGNWSGFKPDHCATLAAWITMTVMVLEFADVATIAITDAERFQFYDQRQPLDGWGIWIGRAVSSFDRWWWHKALGLSYVDPGGSRSRRNYDTQNTTVILGQFIFHAFSSTNDRIKILSENFTPVTRLNPHLARAGGFRGGNPHRQ